MAGRGFPEGEVLEGLRWEARRRRGTGRRSSRDEGEEDSEFLGEEADGDASRIFAADERAAGAPELAARGGSRLVAGLRGRLAGAEAAVERLKVVHAGRDADAARLRARVRDLETERRNYRGKLKLQQRGEETQSFLTPGGGGEVGGTTGIDAPPAPASSHAAAGRNCPPADELSPAPTPASGPPPAPTPARGGVVGPGARAGASTRGRTPHSGVAERHGSQLRRAAEAESEARARLGAAEARAQELQSQLNAAREEAEGAAALREEVASLKAERQGLLQRAESEAFERSRAEDAAAATGASLRASETAYAALREEHRALRSTKIRRDHKADRLHEKVAELTNKLEEQTKLREKREEDLASLEDRMRVIRRKNEAFERSVARERALREEAGREMQIKEEECRLMANIIRQRAEEDRARLLAGQSVRLVHARSPAHAPPPAAASPLGGAQLPTRRGLEATYSPAEFSFSDSLPPPPPSAGPPIETIDLPSAISDAELRHALDEQGLEGIAADPEMEALVEESEAAGGAGAGAGAVRRDSLI